MIFLIVLFIIFLILWIILYNLDLNFRFEKCEVIYNEKAQNKLDIKEVKLYVDLITIKKIKILTIKVNKEYCEVFDIKSNLDGIKLSKNKKENSLIFILRNLDKIKPCINKFDLNLYFGTREMIVTIFLVPILSTYISIIYSKYSEGKSYDNFYLKINPNYFNVNNFSLKFSANIYLNALNFLFFILDRRRNKFIEKK